MGAHPAFSRTRLIVMQPGRGFGSVAALTRYNRVDASRLRTRHFAFLADSSDRASRAPAPGGATALHRAVCFHV